MRAGKGDAVLQGKEAVAAGFLVLDREADKIPRRLALPPVHREQRHAVAAMQLQREGRRRVRAADLKLTTSHQPPPCCACARTSVRIVPRSACNIAHIHVRRYADLPRSTAASGGDGRSHWMGSRGGRSQRELPASSLLVLPRGYTDRAALTESGFMNTRPNPSGEPSAWPAT